MRVIGSLITILSACVAGCLAPGQIAEPDAAARVSTRIRAGSDTPAQLSPDDGPVDTLVVNGETLTARDLCGEMGREFLTRSTSASNEAFRTHVERGAVQWINDKINEMLLYEQATRLHPEEIQENIDKFVDAEIRKIVTAKHGGIQRRYEKHLALEGRTLQDVRARLRREIIISSYLEGEVKSKIAEPTRADLFAAFQENRASWRRPPRRRMSLIDVRTNNRLAGDAKSASPEQIEAARAEAKTIVEFARLAVVNGSPFVEIAVRHSDGLHRGEGGAWGWVTPGSVRERFEPAVEALYDLQAGEVSDVIQAEGGFFLVRCDEIDPGAEPTFQDVQPRLKQLYTRNMYNRMLTELVAELRGRARIEPADLGRFRDAVIEAAANYTLPRAP